MGISHSQKAFAWGKSAHFIPEVFVKKYWSGVPQLLVDNGVAVHPKMLPYGDELRGAMEKMVADRVWEGFSDDDRDFLAKLSAKHGVLRSDEPPRRSLRLQLLEGKVTSASASIAFFSLPVM